MRARIDSHFMLALRVVAKATLSRSTRLEPLIGSNQMHRCSNKKAHSLE